MEVISFPSFQSKKKMNKKKKTKKIPKEKGGKQRERENVVFLLFSSPSPLAQHNNKHTNTQLSLEDLFILF